MSASVTYPLTCLLGRTEARGGSTRTYEVLAIILVTIYMVRVPSKSVFFKDFFLANFVDGAVRMNSVTIFEHDT